MKSKRIMSALLAGVMLTSTVLASCSKQEKEPPKSKRTNVYSGDEITLPADITYIDRIDYKNGKLYATYNTTYTITRNELGEEVERRVGYFWDDGANDVPVANVEPEEEIAAEVEATDDGETEAAAETETEVAKQTAETGTPVAATTEETSEETSTKLPDGWYYDYQNVQSLTVMDVATGEATTTAMPTDIPGYSQSMVIGSDGSVNMIYNNYSWDEETQVSTNTYTLVKIDAATGEVKSQMDLSEAFQSAGLDLANTYIGNMQCADNGDIYITSDATFLVFDADMNYKTKFTLDNGYINSINIDGDKVYVMYYGDSQGLCVVENGTKTDIKGTNLTSALSNMYEMLGFYNGQLYYRTQNNISKYDPNTDTITEEMNFINSDISQDQINTTKLLPDGQILIAAYDYSSGSNKLTVQLMHKVPDDEIQEEVIVTLGAMYSNYNIVNAIIKFNKQGTGLRVSLVTYDKYNNEDNEYTGGVTQFNNDIITGNIPDIILLDSSLPVESYFQKGIFADLNQFVDDPEVGINRSDYLTNLFDACTVDGKLYSMIMSFNLRTLVAKSKYVGTESGWTFEDMMKAVQNMPEGMKAFFDASRSDIINNFLGNSMDSFINWETGETKFESQGFIDFIKFLATCPEKGFWEAYYDSMGGNYVYDEEKEQEMNQQYELRFFNDLALFDFEYISSFTDLIYERNTFASKDITPVGYPTDSGNGAIIQPNIELAISQVSQVKKAAWEVLKYFLNDDGVSKRSYNFSSNISHLESLASSAKDNFYYYNRTDDDFQWYKDQGYSDDYIEYLKNSNQPFEQEVVDITMNLIKNATQVSRSDSDLLDIINEELSGFFGGTKTAEETAKVIASRAKIYVSEHS